jgi:hypothetical protein
MDCSDATNESKVLNRKESEKQHSLGKKVQKSKESGNFELPELRQSFYCFQQG